MKVIQKTEGQAQLLAQQINDQLAQQQRVIWLVPGGSNIAISVAASQLIDAELSKQLIILQTDERYVTLDHPDCNWLQLLEAGFDVKNSTVFPILTNDNISLDEAVQNYARIVEQEFRSADYIIGQFGVGADGHIAGIKPESEAATALELVAGFVGDDFTRITLTFPALRRINSALVFAYGADKRWVFERLAQNQPTSLDKFPAGILTEIKQSVLYNDQIASAESI